MLRTVACGGGWKPSVAAIGEAQIEALVQPFLDGVPGGVAVPDGMYGQLAAYLELLLKWNARTNLTAIRAPEEIVKRHFGESLFAAGVLMVRLGDVQEVMDLGSGAGFPGVPTQILLPRVRMTLVESQGKKAAFLREVTRVLGLDAAVWANRVEAMAAERQFDAVMLRAVDRMEAMVEAGRARVRRGGMLLEMVGESGGSPTEGDVEAIPVPCRAGSLVRLTR